MLQIIIHYGLHLLIIPGVLAYIFHTYFDHDWKKVFLIVLLTTLIDLDHLFASPIFDPNRCSIGFHFLHSHYAIIFYGILTFFKRTQILAIGLMLHIITDLQDCFWMI